jgi:hypothetical protein
MAIPRKEATDVAPAILSHFYTFGLPKILLTDGGREFRNSLQKQIWEALGIRHRHAMQCPGRGMEQELETLSGNSNPRRGTIDIRMEILSRAPSCSPTTRQFTWRHVYHNLKPFLVTIPEYHSGRVSSTRATSRFRRHPLQNMWLIYATRSSVQDKLPTTTTSITVTSTRSPATGVMTQSTQHSSQATGFGCTSWTNECLTQNFPRLGNAQPSSHVLLMALHTK